MVSALTFPLSLDAFWDKLRLSSMSINPHEPKQIDRTASGVVLDASLGDTVWRGSARIAADPNIDNGAEIEALLSLADRVGSTFLVYDVRKPYPKSDPTGSIISGYSPTVTSVESDNRRLTIGNLPSSYVVSPGDLIGIEYGSPTARGLYRVVQGATASSGTVGPIEVAPFIAGAVTGGDAVTFVKPTIEVKMEGPQFGGGTPRLISGASFQFVQTHG